MDSRLAKQLEIFEEAVALPVEEREALLDQACGADPELRQSVERLLKAHDRSGILDRPGSPVVELGKEQVRKVATGGVGGILEKPGDQLGQYRLRRLLGEGGFGAVFLADQQGAISRQVALKIIKPGMDTRPVIARFEAERQALALMEHPSIAKVFDAGTTGTGRPYFVMEYVDGKSITQYCDEQRLGLRARLKLFAKVARAVHHAHQKGIIHRDLKPSNIMIKVATEGYPVPKVIDFGIAKAIYEPLTDSTLLTQHGQVVGTPEYMSPEQASTSGADVDIRTDVYSLGVVLYELLTGVRPFGPETSRREWLAEVQKRDPVRPSQRLAQLGEGALQLADERRSEPQSLIRQLRNELDWIVLKAIAPERSRRYESVAAFAADIQAFLENRPVEATPPSASYRLSKFIGRHKAGLAAASAAVLALMLGLAFATWGFIAASRERDAAQLARDEAEAVVKFLSGMLASANPSEQGRDVTVVEVLGQAASDLDSAFAEQPLVEARLHHTLGTTYWSLGNSPTAQNHFERAVSIREKELGPLNQDTLNSLAALGATFYAQGQLSQAEELFRRALEGMRATLGEENQLTLGVLNNLAQLQSLTGRVEEAAELQKQVYEGQVRLLGADHPHTLGSLLNIAQLRFDQGKQQEGAELLEEAWEAWREAHGEEHPGTLMAQQNLANAYGVLNDLERAEELSRQVWEISKRTLGEHHPETATSQYNLASFLSVQGKTQEALELWEAIVLGPEEASHLRVRSAATSDLLEAHQSQGWPDPSLPVLEASYQFLRRVTKMPDALPLQLNDAAWFLMSWPDTEKRDVALALKAAQRACDLESRREGGLLWRYLDTLALAQHANGESRKALETQKEALQLLPADGEAHRAEMEEHLKQFQSAANGSP